MYGKILARQALAEVLANEKADGKKVVFTNGCFDIIHRGHVTYLAEAKSLGDILVVALNSDSSVSRIKPGRPINNEMDRSEVLSSLQMVDYVTFFDEDTPYELIKLLRPDVLVKGGDWDIKDVVGADIVPETRCLPFIEGVSTTDIIHRIKTKN